jgi:hypothetical protein
MILEQIALKFSASIYNIPLFDDLKWRVDVVKGCNDGNKNDVPLSIQVQLKTTPEHQTRKNYLCFNLDNLWLDIDTLRYLTEEIEFLLKF